MKKVDDCKPLLENSMNETPAQKKFGKKTVRARSSSSVSGAILHTTGVFDGSIKTDEERLVAGCGFHPTNCSETRQASCGCSAWSGYREKSSEKGREASEKRLVVE